MLTNALVKIFLVGPVLDMASGVHSGESQCQGSSRLLQTGVWSYCLAQQSNLRSSCGH